MEHQEAFSALNSGKFLVKTIFMIFHFRPDQIFLRPQNVPLGCHGVVTFSKHPIIISKFVEFNENIDEMRERIIVRGFSGASIMVSW